MPKLQSTPKPVLPNMARRAALNRASAGACAMAPSPGSDHRDPPTPPSTLQLSAPTRLTASELRTRPAAPPFPITLSAARDTQRHLMQRLEQHCSTGSSSFDFDEDCDQARPII